MESKKSHNPPSASWIPRIPGNVVPVLGGPRIRKADGVSASLRAGEDPAQWEGKESISIFSPPFYSTQAFTG